MGQAMLSYDQQIMGRHQGAHGSGFRSVEQVRASQVAFSLYRRSRQRAWQRGLLSALTRRARALLDLSGVEQACPIGNRRYVGVQTVSLAQIRGSEGRCRDFDVEFLPLHSHNEDRWIRVASARPMGIALPPVELIQVGAFYFVRDGHHRVSVAAAWGETHIEAMVTVWEVSGALPWQQPVPSRSREAKLA
jgi:hypothetical protein